MAAKTKTKKVNRTKIEDDGPSGAPQHDFSEGPLMGTYDGSREVKTTFGDKMLHSFTTDAGPEVVFGRSMLDRLLEKVEVGQTIEVVETGRRIKTKTGGSLKEFEVYLITESE